MPLHLCLRKLFHVKQICCCYAHRFVDEGWITHRLAMIRFNIPRYFIALIYSVLAIHFSVFILWMILWISIGLSRLFTRHSVIYSFILWMNIVSRGTYARSIHTHILHMFIILWIGTDWQYKNLYPITHYSRLISIFVLCFYLMM